MRSLIAWIAITLCCCSVQAQTCSAANAQGLVSCSATGPIRGNFTFPAGVTGFTIRQFTSGNGGRNDADQSFAPGAQISNPFFVPIPSSQPYTLSFYLGMNGIDGSARGSQRTPYGGQGNGLAGDGGGPSAVSSIGLFLGGAGGSSNSGPGGSAGTGNGIGCFAGGDGQILYNSNSGTMLDQASAGHGGGSTNGTQGQGGYSGGYGPPTSGFSGSSDGSGGDGDSSYYQGSDGNGAGGGGSFTGAGGGGATDSPGGGGNSCSSTLLTNITARYDTAAPSLTFTYYLPAPFSNAINPTSNSGCTGMDSNGKVVCSFGPTSALSTFSFPAGVQSFTLLSLSSGNGETFHGPPTATQYSGGSGAQLGAPVTFAIPRNYKLSYWIGMNGADYRSTSSKLIAPQGGNVSGSQSGYGGGTTFLPGLGIFFGGGGGAAYDGPGGNAGTGIGYSRCFAGANGQDLSGSGDNTFGFGGSSTNRTVGQGGKAPSYYPTYSGSPGTSDGSGGKGFLPSQSINGSSFDPSSFLYGAGGGASMTGSGGGGGMNGAGGGGNSCNSVNGLTIVPRTDSGSPGMSISFVVNTSTTASTFLPSPNTPSCTTVSSTGITTCTIRGQAWGSYTFPPNVTSFTLISMTSGNGGSASTNMYQGTPGTVPGGSGAQLAGNISFSIPAGYSLPFFVGGNGVDGEVGPSAATLGNGPDDLGCLSRGSAATAPAYGGLAGSSWSGSGGGPTFLPDQGIFLGAGAGSVGAYDGSDDRYAPSNAGTGNGIGCFAGGSCSSFNSDCGMGGSAAWYQPGAGGVTNDNDGTPQPIHGQNGALGNGGAGNFLSSSPGYRCFSAGGGGGSMTGGGGGGSIVAPGGAGNSCTRQNINIIGRTDTSTPSLVFQYSLKGSSIAPTTTSIPPVSQTSTSIPTATGTQTSIPKTPRTTRCSGPDAANTITCTITGDGIGSFALPTGSKNLTLQYLSSGNGGTALYDPNYCAQSFCPFPPNAYPGGTGALVVGPVPLQAPGNILRYYLGANGSPGVSVSQNVPGPSTGGSGWGWAGSGAAASYLPDQGIYLGGGGGGARCGMGGSAGFSKGTRAIRNTCYAGSPGNYTCSSQDPSWDVGMGGSAVSGSNGAGGQYWDYDSSTSSYRRNPAFDGYAGSNGSGGNGCRGSLVYWEQQAWRQAQGGAGAGGSPISSGGGGSAASPGGGGTSCAPAGVLIQSRTDSQPPKLVFQYQLSNANTTTTLLRPLTANLTRTITRTLSGTGLTTTRFLTSTVLSRVTTQDRGSVKTSTMLKVVTRTTQESVRTTTINKTVTQSAIKSTLTSTIVKGTQTITTTKTTTLSGSAPVQTRVVTITSKLPDVTTTVTSGSVPSGSSACRKYELDYAPSCCPTAWMTLQTASTVKVRRHLDRRALTTIPTTVATATFTRTLTVNGSIVVKTTTKYTPTVTVKSTVHASGTTSLVVASVTSTSLVDKAASTATVAATRVVTLPGGAVTTIKTVAATGTTTLTTALPASGTIKTTTSTATAARSTITKTVTASSPSCPPQSVVASRSSCAITSGTVASSFKAQATSDISYWKAQGTGLPVAVNCGAAGNYYF